MPLLASDYDKPRFLHGVDSPPAAKYRIKIVNSEVLKDKTGNTEKKLILSFTNSDRQLALNKGNLRTLKGAFGDDTANWINKVIVVFTVPTEFGPGLRIRIPPPKQPQPAAPQQPVTAGNGAAAAPVSAAAPQQAAASGNGAAVAAAALVAAPLAAAALASADPELDPDPVKPIGDDLEDEVLF